MRFLLTVPFRMDTEFFRLVRRAVHIPFRSLIVCKHFGFLSVIVGGVDAAYGAITG